MFKLAPEGLSLRDVNVWDELYEAMERGKVIEARIIRLRRIDGQGGTWELGFDDRPGVTGLCPASQTGLPEKTPLNNFVGQKISCKVMKIDRENEMLACSRREAVEISLARIIDNLATGEVIKAVVRAVTRSVYVDIGGGVVLRILRDKARLSDGVPLDVQYEEGSVIKVRVTEISKENKSIEVEPVDPWEEHEYKRGEVVVGKVVALKDNIAFVCVKAGIIGRVYYKKMDNYKIGDYVEYQVTDFDRMKRRLHMIRWDSKRVSERRRQKARNNGRRDPGLAAGNEIKTLGGFKIENNKDKDAKATGETTEMNQ